MREVVGEARDRSGAGGVEAGGGGLELSGVDAAHHGKHLVVVPGAQAPAARVLGVAEKMPARCAGWFSMKKLGGCSLQLVVHLIKWCVGISDQVGSSVSWAGALHLAVLKIPLLPALSHRRQKAEVPVAKQHFFRAGAR
jgi:hypothetical protein